MKVHTSIYQLSDDLGPRYVGQTISDPKKRRNDHVSDALNRAKTHKDNWIRSVIARGGTISVEVLESGDWTRDERDEREIYWIAEYKSRGIKLTNMTNGGLSHDVSDEMKERLSIASREVWTRAEYRERVIKLKPIECATCGLTFKPRRARDQTCSSICGQALGGKKRVGLERTVKEAVCLHCGREFRKKKAVQVTCSYQCAADYRGVQLARPYPSGVCINCGVTYTRTRKNRARKTCSEVCRYEVVVKKRKNNG